MTPTGARFHENARCGTFHRIFRRFSRSRMRGSGRRVNGVTCVTSRSQHDKHDVLGTSVYAPVRRGITGRGSAVAQGSSAILLRATLEHEIRQLDRAAHVGDPNDALYASSRRRLLEQVGRESRDGAIVCPQFACRSAVEALEKLGHEPYARGFWLHTGPIGKTSTVVRIHGTNERNGVAFTSVRIATPPGLVRFEGWRHDQIALVDAPADTDAVMRMFPLASEGSGLRVLRRPLAIVWSWARLRDDGPGLMWLAPRGGEPFVHHTFCPVTPTASERHTLNLALELIRGEHKAS